MGSPYGDYRGRLRVAKLERRATVAYKRVFLRPQGLEANARLYSSSRKFSRFGMKA